jgi:hypothetical protein
MKAYLPFPSTKKEEPYLSSRRNSQIVIDKNLHRIRKNSKLEFIPNDVNFC